MIIKINQNIKQNNEKKLNKLKRYKILEVIYK